MVGRRLWWCSGGDGGVRGAMKLRMWCLWWWEKESGGGGRGEVVVEGVEVVGGLKRILGKSEGI